MRHVHVIVLLVALSSHATFARGRRVARPNPIAALQNMFNGYNMPMPRNRRLPVETGMPVNRMDIPLPYMKNVEQKCPCQLEQPCLRVLPEMRVPEILKMQEIRRQEMPRIPEMRTPVPMFTEMPKQYVPNMQVMPTPARVIPEVIDMPVAIRNIPEVVNMPIIKERYECPCASPKALVNPFLPAASPVSAYAPPTSNLLPPVIPNLGRNQFLRKIPIPPPTL